MEQVAQSCREAAERKEIYARWRGGKNELKMRARCCFSAGSGSRYLQATFAEMEHECGVDVIIHVKEAKILPLMVRVGTGGCGRNCGGLLEIDSRWMDAAGRCVISRSLTQAQLLFWHRLPPRHPPGGGGLRRSFTLRLFATTWDPSGGAVSQATAGAGMFRGALT